MNSIAEILAAPSIDPGEAEQLLAAYPGLGKMLAQIAAKRQTTYRDVRIRKFTAADVVGNWSARLDRAMVGLVSYEASGDDAVRPDRRLHREMVRSDHDAILVT